MSLNLKRSYRTIILGSIIAVITVCLFLLLLKSEERKSRNLTKQNASFITEDQLDSLFIYDLKSLEIKIKDFYVTALEDKNKADLAYAYYYKFAMDMKKNKQDSLSILSDKALFYAKESENVELEAKVHHLTGRRLLLVNDYTNSLNNFIKAMSYFEDVNDSITLPLVYNDLGIFYFALKEIDTSILYHQKAFDIFKAKYNSRGESLVYANLSNIYIYQKEYVKAKKILLQSTSNFEKLKDTVNIVKSLIHLGVIEQRLNNLGEALGYFTNACVLAQKIENVALEGVSNFRHGLIYDEKQDYVQALKYYKKAFQMSKEVNNHEGELEILSKISEIYNKTGDYRSSLEYLRKYYLLQDSIKGSDVRKEIENLQWDTVLKKKDYEFEIAHQKNKNLMKIYVIIIMSVIFIIIVVLILYRNKNKFLRISNLENIRLKEKMSAENEINRLKQERYESEMKTKKEVQKLQLRQYEMDVEVRNRDLTTLSLELLTKNKLLVEIEGVITKETTNIKVLLEELEKTIKQNRDQDKNWEKFQDIFQTIHPTFFQTIQSQYPQLTTTEIRICAYIRINMNTNEIAAMLNISSSSFITARYRIRKKLNLNRSDNLDEIVKKW